MLVALLANLVVRLQTNKHVYRAHLVIRYTGSKERSAILLRSAVLLVLLQVMSTDVLLARRHVLIVLLLHRALFVIHFRAHLYSWTKRVSRSACQVLHRYILAEKESVKHAKALVRHALMVYRLNVNPALTALFSFYLAASALANAHSARALTWLQKNAQVVSWDAIFVKPLTIHTA